ncbi:MAG: hypothetical protein AAFR87_18300, partial [Bacteroidota bacterium]
MNRLISFLLAVLLLISFEGNAQEEKKWFAIFGESEDIDNTGYNRTDSRWELESEIQQRWKDGYDLLEIEYGEGHWYALFGKSEDLRRTSFFGSTNLLEWETESREILGNGFIMLDIEFGDGLWYGVYAQSDEMEDCRISRARDINALQRDIKNNWDDGYELLD